VVTEGLERLSVVSRIPVEGRLLLDAHQYATRLQRVRVSHTSELSICVIDACDMIYDSTTIGVQVHPQASAEWKESRVAQIHDIWSSKLLKV